MEQSKDVTDFFVSFAREFLDEWPLTSLVCAYAGGSVGRGEGEPSCENRLFRGHVIQLQVQSAPTDEDVYESVGMALLKRSKGCSGLRGSFHFLDERHVRLYGFPGWKSENVRTGKSGSRFVPRRGAGCLKGRLSLSLQKIGFFQADEQLLADLRCASVEIIAEIG
ncbi:hypothetical protein ACFU8X_22185 [Brevibacillus porteri]|uniref:hypothetical protein n=1 Tax=Brevibacillus porteri TaxID=2126350 RepID=UPI00370A873F